MKAPAIAGAGTLGMRKVQMKPCRGDAENLRRPHSLFSLFPNPGFRPLRVLQHGVCCIALSAMASFIPTNMSVTGSLLPLLPFPKLFSHQFFHFVQSALEGAHGSLDCIRLRQVHACLFQQFYWRRGASAF